MLNSVHVFLIFVAAIDYENIFTTNTSISRFTVYRIHHKETWEINQ